MSLHTQIIHRRKKPNAASAILEEKRKYRARKAEEREKSEAHSGLLAALINYFFPEFLSCFFPDVYSQLRLEGIKPLPENVSNMVRKTDQWTCTGFQVQWKSKDAFILVYMNPVSTHSSYQLKLQTEITSLCQAQRKPIIPIVVFTRHRDGKSERYCLKRLFPKTPYTPFSSQLLVLNEEKWRKHAGQANPVAAALISRMDHLPEEKLQMKKACLSILENLKLNPAEVRFIIDYFEAYLKLEKREEERFLKEMDKMALTSQMLDLTNSWEERGFRKGIELGKEMGLEQAISAMLKRKFPSEMISEITGLELCKIKSIAGME